MAQVETGRLQSTYDASIIQCLSINGRFLYSVTPSSPAVMIAASLPARDRARQLTALSRRPLDNTSTAPPCSLNPPRAETEALSGTLATPPDSTSASIAVRSLPLPCRSGTSRAPSPGGSVPSGRVCVAPSTACNGPWEWSPAAGTCQRQTRWC